MSLPSPGPSHPAADLDAPAWFVEALAHRPTSADVDGAEVRTAVRAWGRPGDPLVVLVHGGAAHAAWWDHLAPGLARHRRVVAPDLAGHGDSGWLERYSLDSWRRQVVEVVEQEDPSTPVLLVGHSMGGVVAMLAAHDLGERIGGLVLVDTEVPVTRDGFTRPEWAPSPTRRVHPDLETIVGRFRTLPRGGAHRPWAARHVAEHSVAPVPGGWSWKFDPTFFDHDRPEIDDLRPLASADLSIVRAEHGLVEPHLAVRVARALGRPHVPITIPGSGHHVPLDEPVALAAVLAQAARTWCPVDPHDLSTTPEGAR